MKAMFRRTLSVGRAGRPHWTLLGSPPNRSRHRGFTLVEVLMSVVLMGIGVALALPSYRDMVEKRQVTNGAEQLAAFINSAQGAAMKSNSYLTISYDPGAWCIGASFGSEEKGQACDCEQTDHTAADFCQFNSQIDCSVAENLDTQYCQNSQSPDILNKDNMGGLELVHGISGDGAYTFNPVRGIFEDLNDALTIELRSQSGDFRLNLMVNQTGRVILCSEDADHAIPGYAICDGPGIILEPGDPIVDPVDPGLGEPIDTDPEPVL